MQAMVGNGLPGVNDSVTRQRLSKAVADGNCLNQDSQDFRIFRISVSILSILIGLTQLAIKSLPLEGEGALYHKCCLNRKGSYSVGEDALTLTLSQRERE